MHFSYQTLYFYTGYIFELGIITMAAFIPISLSATNKPSNKVHVISLANHGPISLICWMTSHTTTTAFIIYMTDGDNEFSWWFHSTKQYGTICWYYQRLTCNYNMGRSADTTWTPWNYMLQPTRKLLQEFVWPGY